MRNLTFRSCGFARELLTTLLVVSSFNSKRRVKRPGAPGLLPAHLQRSRPADDILSGKVVGEEQPGFGGAPNLVAKSETGAMQIQYMDWQVK